MASAALRLLCALSAAAMATARPSASSDEETPKWRLYFENDTVTGKEVPCTAEDRFCLSRGLLHHEPNGKCYLYGDRGPCDWDEYLRVDKQEFLYGSGRVRGACVKKYLCDEAGKFRMAYDGSCLGYGELQDICYAQPGVTQSEDMFGETVCSCASKDCPVEQQLVEALLQDKLAEGRCAVWDLRATQLPRLSWAQQAATAREEVPCSEAERRCLLDGRVHLAERDLCFELWRQGPCAPGHWFLLDQHEAVNGTGRLVGVCKALPCGVGRVQSIEDGSCHAPEELCGAYPVAFDVFGAAACSSSLHYHPHLRLPTQRAAQGRCVYPGLHGEHHPQYQDAPPPAPPACPDAHTGYCQRHVHRKPAPPH